VPACRGKGTSPMGLEQAALGPELVQAKGQELEGRAGRWPNKDSEEVIAS
jgi:hypothetical protein